MLSNNLMKNIIKAVTNDPKPSTINSIYGSLLVNGEDMYVQLDGSQEQTPVVSTVTGETGDRVTVNIQDHVAMITGNLTKPAINKKELDSAFEKYAEIILKDIDKILGVEEDSLKEFIANTTHTIEKYDGFLGSVMETEFTLETILGGKAEGTVINSLVQTAGSNEARIEGMYEVFGIKEENGNFTSAVVNRVSSVEQDLGTFKTEVSTTYQTADGVIETVKSNISQTDSAIRLAVSNVVDGKVNRDAIIELINNKNGSSANISADVVNIDGSVVKIGDYIKVEDGCLKAQDIKLSGNIYMASSISRTNLLVAYLAGSQVQWVNNATHLFYNDVTFASGITLGGVTRTSWPSGSGGSTEFDFHGQSDTNEVTIPAHSSATVYHDSTFKSGSTWNYLVSIIGTGESRLVCTSYSRTTSRITFTLYNPTATDYKGKVRYQALGYKI